MRRFGHEIDGSQFERPKNVVLVAVRRDDDDRYRLLGHQNAQEGKTIHFGHFEVERNGIGFEGKRNAQCLFPVGCFADHFDFVTPLENVSDASAIRRRIIDYEDSEPTRFDHGITLASATVRSWCSEGRHFAPLRCAMPTMVCDKLSRHASEQARKQSSR